ncbi:hypothetical protein KQX54_001189 [Cotesia glomerata]|uniref:Uncharacterized protein n=1 Tax=Cotesia glomerata TaxID=32391 RepID=A0AAV7IVR2_COTGL|nr:hypothetical protein KQX54_001189 [Cotesia glomerata]
MSVPKKPMLALLQWIGGEYDQSYTAGVPITWILDFDSETFDPCDMDTSYVVEWQESKKGSKPKKGWKCYDARVIKISRSLKSLEKEIEILEGLVSPLRPVRTLEAIRNNLKNPLKRTLEKEFEDSTVTGQPDSQKPGISNEKLFAKKKCGNAMVQSDNLQNKCNDDSIQDCEHEEIPEQLLENKDGGKATSNQHIHRDNQLIKQMLSTLVNEVRDLKKSQAEMNRVQANNQNHQQDANALVEIGHAGSNVFIQHQQWLTADSRSTFQSMGLSLVRALFDDEILLQSNFKGGASKINKNAPQRPGLDANIMAAIKGELLLELLLITYATILKTYQQI